MTAEPLVHTQKGHTAAEREEVCLQFCISLNKRSFSDLFYLPLHFFLAGSVTLSHSLLSESRQVFLQSPLTLLLSRPEDTTLCETRPPPPGTPRADDPCARPARLATGTEGKDCMMGTTEFRGTCFKSSLDNSCLVEWKLIVLLLG